jgi:hypothetical protein
MNDQTLLLRQVHPAWRQAGGISSQVFRPTAKDGSRLSVYDGDMIPAPAAWAHYTSVLGYRSSGVVAVSAGECRQEDLRAEPDPTPFPEHAVIDFGSLNRREMERKAKRLKLTAEARGWLHAVA